MAQTGKAVTPATDTASVNCFSGQGFGPIAERAAASTVGIGLAGSDNRSAGFGSGFIVADSHSPENPHNKIITAFHVSAPPGGHVVIIASDGDRIGTAKVAATGTGMTVLSLTGFYPGMQNKYDGLPGLVPGPQDRGNYLGGIIATPAGITEGNSGGPLVNAKGEVIGVVQSGNGGSGKSIIYVPTMWHPFIPGTHELNKVPLTMDEPDRLYATTLADPKIRKALGPAGQNIEAVTELPETAATIYGVPNGGCVVSSGDVKPLNFKSIRDFKVIKPEPIDPALQFPFWDDPKKGSAELKSLLDEAQAVLPANRALAEVRKAIAPQNDLGKMNLVGLHKALIDWANHVPDSRLAQRLVDAAYNVDAWNLRQDLAPSFMGIPARRALPALESYSH